ncbi:MAG: 3-deoxy-D-manno-octulosonic acid transferase [Prevotella sp.]|nr:3-deoxy-D-manno-octulosonic acid transferase [Prevotella sp.]
MYNLFIYLYQLGVFVYSFFNEKVKKMWRGEREAFRILKEQVDPTAQYVWFHAASLGEFEQGRPLMERLRQEHPEYKILLTFFSPSGYEVRKNYQGADIICYLPLDTVTNARRFLRLIRPVMAFFIKYEFWYNYLHILKHRRVPVYSVSSIFRPDQVFFKWYGRQYGRVLNCFTHFFVQNEISKELLAGIGLTNVSIVGDTRFDRVLQIKEAAKQLPIVEAFLEESGVRSQEPVDMTAPKVFVAGSSWLPDEDIFIRYFNAHKNWKLIIAPHVIGEDHLQQIEKLLEGRKVIRYTAAEKSLSALRSSLSTYDVLIIDCFGLLSSIYHYGEIAYVGGGFGVGIHNTLEAAVWDVPVFFGPNNQKFQEAQGLKAAGGGFDFQTYEEFAEKMDRFLVSAEERRVAGVCAGRFVQSLAGATEKVLSACGLLGN